ncbi:PiggyBac transposable element-derived protein 4 [Trichostrongylus colubriformis]|uniref:PiggyBac transposable element-derived protein 4 n=1 Tax=Trichostrongylus colubriformis TaxID=6319 RepID=A0AAN8IP20_TRICO
MGIVRLPTLRAYWSPRKIYGGNSVCGSVMSRNRFETILGALHFCNNDAKDESDRLFKIASVLDSFNSTVPSVFTPGQCLTIDESMIPFRGRIYFQYIPDKKHKFGLKLLKLCAEGDYTLRVDLYCDRVTERCGSAAETVVMKLMSGFLDCGRRLYCDNWYSSMSLVEKFINRYTDYVGTFRKNRLGFQKAVPERKLKKEKWKLGNSKMALHNKVPRQTHSFLHIYLSWD